MRIRGTLLAAILSLAAAGACAGDGSTRTEGSDPSSGSTAPPTTEPPDPSASASAPPEAEIADGRHFVFVKETGDTAVTFDLAILLSGRAAEEAAEKAGDEIPVPNDYYIVNDDPKLRTVIVGDAVEVSVYDWSRCCDDHTRISFDDFTGIVARPTEHFHGTLSPYWIRVRDGRIVRIEEQYLP